MNKENIIEYIKAPELLEQGNLDFLKQVVNEFPFFQTSRLLLLKTLQNIDSVTFEDELQLTAIHVSNRKKMHFLLHPDVSVEVFGTENNCTDNDKLSHESETDKTAEMKKIRLSEIISKRLAEIKRDDVQDTTKAPYDFENRPGKDFEHIADVILQKAAASKKIKTEMQKASLNTQQECEPLDVDFNLLEIDEAEKMASDFTANNEAHATGDKKIIQNKELLQIENAEEEISTTHYDKSMELLFSHKLNILDLKLPSEIFTEEEDQEEDEEEDLIERFIKNNPTIDRKILLEPPAEHKDFSVESIKETEEYLTDTLANIYIKQGNYSKAILAYEKLSLKYPGKSTYFADQIKKIKRLIKKL